MENECTTHIRRLNHVTQMAKRITDNSLNCNPTIGAIHFFGWQASFLLVCPSARHSVSIRAVKGNLEKENRNMLCLWDQ